MQIKGPGRFSLRRLLDRPERLRRAIWTVAIVSIGVNLLALVQPIFMLHVYDSVESACR